MSNTNGGYLDNINSLSSLLAGFMGFPLLVGATKLRGLSELISMLLVGVTIGRGLSIGGLADANEGLTKPKGLKDGINEEVAVEEENEPKGLKD